MTEGRVGQRGSGPPNALVTALACAELGRGPASAGLTAAMKETASAFFAAPRKGGAKLQVTIKLSGEFEGAGRSGIVRTCGKGV